MNILPNNLNLEDFIGVQESQHVRPPTDFKNKIIDRIKNGFRVEGEKLPWYKTFDLVRLRPGEVSIWAGINGHKKSMLLGQVLLWLPAQIKILIASLEMKPEATLERMVKQSLGSNKPDEKYLNRFFDLTENIWLYDQQDSVPSDRILGLVGYAAKELKMQHIAIDSLVKCGISLDDFTAQKDFIDKLSYMAKAFNVHIHLVHHVRKGKDEKEKLSKMDVKGGGEITDLVDNVFLVQTNKSKKEKSEQNKPVDKFEPDQTLEVCKQRHGEWEGQIALWFRENGLQFVGGPDSQNLSWRFETQYPQGGYQ